MKAPKLLAMTPLLGVLLAAPTIGLAGADAHANAGTWWGADWEDETWETSDPNRALRATITWTSGRNTLDGVSTGPMLTYGPENKFDRDSIGWPAARTFTGFSRPEGPGNRGSLCTTWGEGRSFVGITTYWAEFSVYAAGNLGTKPAPPTPMWDAQTTAKDPWPLQIIDLPDPGDPYFDLYVPFGIVGGQPGNGSIDFLASYETAAGTESLLNVHVTAEDVSVEGLAGASFFRMAAMDAVPTVAPGDEVSLAWIQAFLRDQMIAHGRIQDPLYLGIYLDDVVTPRVEIGGGAVALIHDEIRARDLDAVPEPASLIGFACGGALLALRRRKR